LKPKLFVDGRSFDTEYQGTRTYIENLYRVIDQIGDFKVFMASENPAFTQTFFPGARSMEFVAYKTRSKLARAFNEIPAMVRRYKADASHFQYVLPPVRRTVKIVTIHDILFKDFPEEFSLGYKLIKGASFSRSAKKADVLTTVSEYSRKALSTHFGLPLQNIHVVPNGVGPFYFQEYEKSATIEAVEKKFGFRDYLLYVSRLEPRKNQLSLLEAFLELELYRKGKALVFVGKKSMDIPLLDDRLSSLDSNVRRSIHFLENIPNEELRLLYQAAELFVYPSKAEGFGIPPLEAAALGIPTICSNATAMADFSFFGKYHIKPEKGCIKQAIEQFYTNKEPEIKNITRVIKEHYSWEHAAMKLNQLVWGKVNTRTVCKV
jgi:glycosyltransferase involved in cell wall biosynthesis